MAGNYRARVYLGGLPPDTQTQEVGDRFQRYGRIRSLDLKTGYAFVTYYVSGGAPAAAHRSAAQRRRTFPSACH